MIFLYPTAALYHTMITLILYPKINNLSRFLGTVMLILLIADFILVLSSGKRTVVLIFLHIFYTTYGIKATYQSINKSQNIF